MKKCVTITCQTEMSDDAPNLCPDCQSTPKEETEVVLMEWVNAVEGSLPSPKCEVLRYRPKGTGLSWQWVTNESFKKHSTPFLIKNYEVQFLEEKESTPLEEKKGEAAEERRFVYFIEDRLNGKWVSKSLDPIDTSKPWEHEKNKWTNDPNWALSFKTFSEAENFNKEFYYMKGVEVTEHEFVNDYYVDKSQNVEYAKQLQPLPVISKEVILAFLNKAHYDDQGNLYEIMADTYLDFQYLINHSEDKTLPVSTCANILDELDDLDRIAYHLSERERPASARQIFVAIKSIKEKFKSVSTPYASGKYKTVNHHHELTDQHEMVDFGDGEFVANKAAVPLLKALNEAGLRTRSHHIDSQGSGFVCILLDNAEASIQTVSEIHSDRTKYNGKKELLIQWGPSFSTGKDDVSAEVTEEQYFIEHATKYYQDHWADNANSVSSQPVIEAYCFAASKHGKLSAPVLTDKEAEAEAESLYPFVEEKVGFEKYNESQNRIMRYQRKAHIRARKMGVYNTKAGGMAESIYNQLSDTNMPEEYYGNGHNLPDTFKQTFLSQFK